MSVPSRLRIAVACTNDPQNFSGGRYHALMLAYAAAAAGAETHLVTDQIPAFLQDIDPLRPGAVQVHRTADFTTGLPQGAFDWVVLVPTGIFLPEFYEAVLAFAGGAGARLALLNFESANWFNAMAPAPRDPGVWEYWRRCCLGGALVLSSTRESDRWARNFYRLPEGAAQDRTLRFETWLPPINSVAARRFDGIAKDRSLLAFIRPEDTHKGAALLTKLAPALLAGRTLRLVSGKAIDTDFRARLEARLAKAPGASLEVFSRIGDLQKFRLISAAQVVLFPTQFEGYGYPPVEAAYAGTESVCFDLPVLRETVGHIASFAPSPTQKGFESALRQALGQGERRASLRAAVAGFADFEAAALLLGDVLRRSADRVAPLAPPPFRVLVAPFARAPLAPPETIDRSTPIPPLPSHVTDAVTTAAGDVLVTASAYLPAACDEVRASVPDDIVLPAARMFGRSQDGTSRLARLFVVVPGSVLHARQPIRLQPYAAGQPEGTPIEIRVELARPACAAVFAETGEGPDWYLPVLATTGASALLHTQDRSNWRRIAPDVDHENPPALPGPGSLLICLAGPAGQEHAIDLLYGWPPSPRSPFTEPRKGTCTPVLRSRLGMVYYADRTDERWLRGIGRSGTRAALGTVLLQRSDCAARLQPGMVLSFDAAQARRVLATATEGDHCLVTLDGPLDAVRIGYPGQVGVFAAVEPVGTTPSFVIQDRTDRHWWLGVWNQQDERFRRGLAVHQAVARDLGLEPGTRLRFVCSGERAIIAIDDDAHGNRCLWLDHPILPPEDAYTNPVQVIHPIAPDPVGLRISLARAETGWPNGILTTAERGMLPGQAILLEPAEAPRIARGNWLRIGNVTRRAIAVMSAEDGTVVVVNMPIGPAAVSPPGKVELIDPADVPDGMRGLYEMPDPGFTAQDPLFLLLAGQARRAGLAMLPPPQPPDATPRVLVLSLVSPLPSNQGNRVVTRNLIRHVLDQGYGCDIVVQNWIDPAALTDAFGDTARIFAVPHPDWENTGQVRQRRSIAAMGQALIAEGRDPTLGEALDQAAEEYHPGFIVRDATVDIARCLFAQTNYAAIICNYTHMMRVPAELRTLRSLPPVAIVTHDALSRLPRQFDGLKLDHGYRACAPATEADALNAIDGAVVVAISQSEAGYFRDIGVTNPIVLTEFDAAAEMAPYAVPANAFDRRTIVFHGSANPMNMAGLHWFVDHCWPAVHQAVPEATLILCGRASDAWHGDAAGIERVGELSRADMLFRCGAAGMAINPCVAGTGLKIKTVEAACLGLPSVCLPAAIEGLEDIARHFAIVAEDAEGFAEGCIALLTRRDLWSGLRRGALRIAKSRFSADQVYRGLDAAMQWPAAPHATQPARPQPAQPQPPGDDIWTELQAQDDAFFGRAKHLMNTGAWEEGWALLDALVRVRVWDARIATESAALALAADHGWRAVLHAAIAIARCPLLGDGYRLMAAGLIDCGNRADAIATLQQGILAAPADAALRNLLATT